MVIRKQHTSSLGEVVNMEGLRRKHGERVAIGNVRMNARGDILDQANNILIRRDQIVQEYNTQTSKSVKQISLKTVLPDDLMTPEQALTKIYEEKNQPTVSEVDQPEGISGRKGRRLVDDGAE